MFTGIVESIGKIIKAGGNSFLISSNFSRMSKGESISVDGVCLTVVATTKTKGACRFLVDLSEETMEKTTLKNIREGMEVNLERALRFTDRIGGHFVQGHVDGIGKCIQIRPQRNSKIYTFSCPKTLNPFLTEKGSIAVDGISLTMFNVKDHLFSASILPYTEKHTSLRSKGTGKNFNLEADILAKITAKQCAAFTKSRPL